MNSWVFLLWSCFLADSPLRALHAVGTLAPMDEASVDIGGSGRKKRKYRREKHQDHGSKRKHRTPTGEGHEADAHVGHVHEPRMSQEDSSPVFDSYSNVVPLVAQPGIYQSPVVIPIDDIEGSVQTSGSVGLAIIARCRNVPHANLE